MLERSVDAVCARVASSMSSRFRRIIFWSPPWMPASDLLVSAMAVGMEWDIYETPHPALEQQMANKS